MLRYSVRIFVILFLALSLSGCSAAENNKTEVITVWHWMSDRDEVFQKLAKKFEDKYHVQVKFDLYAPSEAYAQRVKAAAQTSKLPDIFGILGEKRDFASFIKSGFVEDLTDELNVKVKGMSWKETLFEKALAVNEFLPGNEYGVKAGYYGIPLDVTTIQMVYNKKLFRLAGLYPDKPPATWDDFLACCKALKEKGIPRFVSGFGEIWMIDALASNYAMNIMGQEKVFSTYEGRVPYTDPDWIKVLSLFKQMADEKILVEGAVTMVNKTAEQTFANERAAFAFNGSWCVNVYKGMNPNLEYGAILPPRAANLHPMRIWGGAGGSFVVNASSPRRRQAIEFLQWLSSDEVQAELSVETQNLPANKKSLGQISPILAQFASAMENATHPNIYPIHEKPAVTEAFDKGIQSILIGEQKPDEVAREVQRIKEKESRKDAREIVP